MKLSKILENINTNNQDIIDCDIKGIAINSNLVSTDFIFVAIPGSKVNGAKFIPEAIKNGASVILVPDDYTLNTVKNNIQFIKLNNIRKDLGIILSSFYDKKPENVHAITGTNGKTSIADFLRQITTILGYNSASMGTLGVIRENQQPQESLTTPDCVTMHNNLNQLANDNINYIAIEASSHGLDQNRLAGVQADVAGFTNLTQDHLDYHKNMETYLEAKSKLFTEVLKPNGVAVLNADIEQFEKLKNICKETSRKFVSYGKNGNEFKLISRLPTNIGQKLNLEIYGVKYEIEIPLVGEFQAMNILCATAMATSLTNRPNKVIETLPKIKGAKGRLEFVGKTPNNASIYIDYAHTPDALKNVINALRPHCNKKLHVLFGCGGDRDKGKRPLMGKIANDLADIVIVTDDNPRSEKAATIRNEIMNACPNGINIGDRTAAIKYAIRTLKNGEVLVLAGKGHETGQKIGNKIIKQSDHQDAIDSIEELFDEPNYFSEKSASWSSEEIDKTTFSISKSSWNANKIVTHHTQINKSCLFVAIKTENYDGHEHIDFALRNGVAACLTCKKDNSIENTEKLSFVDNTKQAIEALGKRARDRFNAKIILFIGSNKYNAKKCYKYLREFGECLYCPKTNDIVKISQTLANISENTKYVIIDIEDNDNELISTISGLCRADITIINDEENDKDFSKVLTGADYNNICVLNADSKNFTKIKNNAKMLGIKNIITYGKNPEANIIAKDINKEDNQITLIIEDTTKKINLGNCLTSTMTMVSLGHILNLEIYHINNLNTENNEVKNVI
jgi:UDP-N-acetylmuramoyl-L-alanyl-D-glutamate--2,6-diaminopimelate ligase